MGRDRWNHSYDHHNMVAGPAGTSTVRTIWKTEDGITECYGTGAPPTTANTYAEGCIYHKANDTAGNTLYVNRGTYASPDFEKILHGELATAADDGGPSPAIWDDAPVMEVMLDPGKGLYHFEDFIQEGDETQVGADVSKATGSGTFTDDPTKAGGVYKLDTAASTSNHEITALFTSLQLKPGVGTHIYFEARVAINDDDGLFIVGLADDGTTDIGGSGTIIVNKTMAVFFRDSDTTTTEMGTQVVDSGGGITTEDDTIDDIDKAAYETFGIHIFGDGDTAGDYVKFYHNGELVKTVTDADGGGDDGVPDAIICPVFTADVLTDGTQLIQYIDWMRVLVYNATSGTVRESAI